MGLETTLLIKHLPRELSTADREELLKIVGAAAVRVMPDDGKMKFSAFATFRTEDDAKAALSILHQKEILGQRLVVEYSKEKHQSLTPHISDYQKYVQATPKDTSVKSSEREILRHEMENFSKALHGIAPALGLDYLPSPLLKYKYPVPTPTTIQNICHALASVPKFYTQVLHLMNKMNLPAPFGPVTPAPPLAQDVIENVSDMTPDVDVIITKDMEVTSEEESEYESESDGGERFVQEKVLPVKRQSKNPKKKIKRRRICLQPPLPPAGPSKPRTEPSEVFESQLIMQKKINVKKIDNIAPVDIAEVSTEIPGGFGAFEAPKEAKDENANKEPGDVIWDDSQFITKKELKEKRISSREMKTMSIFRNFSPGEPTFRLYVKNLARQVEEKDLRYIFGRFIDQNSENDKNMFDIRLMKEGRMKGQAFVTLANEEQAKRAVELTNGFVLHTKPMVVQFARSAKPKESDKKEQKS